MAVISFRLFPASTLRTGSPVQEGKSQDLVRRVVNTEMLVSGYSRPPPPPLTHRIICGLTQFTNKRHVAFAALEAVCFQTKEVSALGFPDWTILQLMMHTLHYCKLTPTNLYNTQI